MHTHRPKILFVLKNREQTWGQSEYCKDYNSSGLYNSANFVCHMLKDEGYVSELVQVIDGNGIDAVVFKHNPDIVILEAIWATPEKIKELSGLRHHKHRKWIIRNHSQLPFLALEGASLGFIIGCAATKNVYISSNSPVVNDEMKFLLHLHHDIKPNNVLLLPNYYPAKLEQNHQFNDYLDVGCFGAIRPLKNHVEQAIASILFANHLKRPLRFHVNSSRVEGDKGDTIIKTLRAVFKDLKDYHLVEHKWLSRPDFLNLCNQMDIGLQVSFSETFNIVAADLVTRGVPCVTSDEVPWMPKKYHAYPTASTDIFEKMVTASEDGVDFQLRGLHKYSEISRYTWIDTLNKIFDHE